jgi:hypothetical protein
MLLLILLLSFTSVTLSLQSTSEYEKLIYLWDFAYGVVSPDKINAHINETEYITDSEVSILTSINHDLGGLPDTTFMIPFACYPYVIAYNIPLLNDTLRLTRSLLNKMILSEDMFWNDPELVLLNPGLIDYPIDVFMMFDGRSTPANDMLIRYFMNVTDSGGSWFGYFAGRYFPASDMTSVIQSLGLIPNSISFIPYTLYKSLASNNIQLAYLIENGKDIHPLESFEVILAQENTNKMIAKTNQKWPFNIPTYFVYDTQGKEYETILKELRFIYWTTGNINLNDKTLDSGLRLFESTQYDTIKSFLLQATFNDQKVLVYDNTSEGGHSLVLYIITIVCTILFIPIVFAAWFYNEKRRVTVVIINHAIIIFGLLVGIPAFIMWSFAAYADYVCISRFWLLNIMYTNVIAAIYIFAFTMNRVYSATNLSEINQGVKVRTYIIPYIVLEVILIVLLVIWTTTGHAGSEEIVIDPIEWKSIYACGNTGGIMELLVYIYHICVSVFTCYVIYKYWERVSPEMVRWLLIASYNQILTFIQLIIVTRVIDLNEDQYYTIIVVFYLFAVANVIFSFFIPSLFRGVKEVVSKSRSASRTSSRGERSLPTSPKESKTPGSPDVSIELTDKAHN